MQATEIPFEATPTGATPQKRLVDHRRAYFRRDDLSGPAPLGSTGRRALLHQRYALALTPGLVDQVYGTKVSAALLDGPGGYAHPDGHPGYWTSSTRELLSPGATDNPAQEFAYARAHFFRPLRLRDPFHTAATSTESFTVLDAHDLLVAETRDALGNTTRAVGLDYRVLRPSRLADPNGNISAVAYDPFGVVAGSAVMGKPAPAPVEGDTLDGFVADPTPAQLQDLLADPRGPLAATLLAGATTRTIVDRNAFRRTPAGPPVTVTIVREIHVSDLPAGAASPLQVRLAYSDGLGRQVQTKVQARAGPVAQRDAAGAVIVGADGQPVLTATDADPRWIASGWTVYNNKGFAVRQYQPFYTDRHQFEFDVRVGVSPITFYDPLGRTVGVLHPDHTWQKTVVGAWRSESWDANDTVALVGAADDDVGGFFERLPAAAHVPTWAALRTDPALAAGRWPDADERAAQRRAAEQAMVHAATPTVAHSDSLGRAVLTVVTNRYKYSDAAPADPPTERSYRNRDVLDVLGRRRAVIDARGRTVLRAAFDLQGNRIHEASMEAGARWSLTDAIGGALVSWDDKGRRFTTRYDVLRRPTGTVLNDGGADVLVADTVYGESRPDPQAANLRGRAVELRDQSGSVTTDRFDFAGNPLRVERALVTDYRSVIDWSGAVGLENERYLSATRFDALNRPIQVIAPHSNQPGAAVKVLQQQYDQGSLLRRLDVWIDESDDPPALLDPASADVSALADVRYDAQGRRIQVDRGNGVRTTARYDPLTQRLAELQSRRNPAAFADCPDPPPAGWPGCQLQNQRFVHDPSGNVAAVRDLAQQAIFFRNRRVTADSDYTYDAFYRLIEATGREHIGQAAPSPTTYNDVARLRIPHPADGNAMARYLERYTYDDVGNLQAVAHVGTDPANPGWTRTYAYAETSLLEPAQHNNRLTSTTVDGVTDVYEYDEHGDTLKMPQLQAMQWDFGDRLRMTRRQAVNAGDADGTAHAGERTYYVYGAGGERLRKITETAAGAVVQDRIQLGGVEILRRAGPSPLTQEILHIPDGSATLAIVETTLSGGPPGRRNTLCDIRSAINSVQRPSSSTTRRGSSASRNTPLRRHHLPGGTQADRDAQAIPLPGRRARRGVGTATPGRPLLRALAGPVRLLRSDGHRGRHLPVRIQPRQPGQPQRPGRHGRRADGRRRHHDHQRRRRQRGTLCGQPGSVEIRRRIRTGNGLHGPRRAQHRAHPAQHSGQVQLGTARHGTAGVLPVRPELEKQFQIPNSEGQRRDLYPMFSALMTEEALEGKVASTVHFDMRKVNPTPKMPPLVPGDPEAATPGYSWADFHSSAEARRVLAHLADTAPGDRKVDIFIEHEDGISIIRKGSGAVEGAPLPQRLAKFVPNLNNSGTRGSGGGTGTAPTGGGAPGGAPRAAVRAADPASASESAARSPAPPGSRSRRRRNRSRRG
ncbi:YD repeat domain protein [Mycobacterium kansasii]|uniref:YD repeat domain protein n=1 Tax=Mycobacterium kansasii TaxID=1768 RepID=A0A1V3XU44_MYCKA|nr:YD repeat domain protein [Mycobacterium kansasii]